MKREYNEKCLPLEGNRKLINACKKAGLECFNPQGSWNGYGYEKLPLHVRIRSLSDMRKFNALKRESQPPVYKSDAEIKAEWVNRLVKLTGINPEVAISIANTKLDYKIDQIDELEKRQDMRYSRQREKIIKKLWRENPLRYIKNKEHALNILSAHERHNTGYDFYIKEARELAQMGEIDKDDVRETARELHKGTR